MTLKELKEKVDFLMLNEINHELTVCIPNNKVAMGGTPVTDIKNCNRGIDWDANKFILWPVKEMIER